MVARKAAKIEKLQKALANKEITLSKARRISSVINTDTADKWLKNAKTLSQRSLEREVAKVNPRSSVQEGAHYISENMLELKAAISPETELMLKRVRPVRTRLRDEFKNANLYRKRRNTIMSNIRVCRVDSFQNTLA